MKYISTRGGVEPLPFSDAVMTGLARDGGLLLPERIPDMRDRLEAWRDLPYVELAAGVMAPYVDLPRDTLAALLAKSYAAFRNPEITPVRRVGELHVLELFHGPTLAFKDVALQFLGNLFEHYLTHSGRGLNIVGATSGDTGSAAIHGTRGRRRIRIFVMHPRGRTSRVQELQMTSVTDPNVFNIAVEGTFDDCQRIMKALFNELDFKDRYSLGSINSINWARVLAQIVYYFYGAFRVMAQTGAERVAFAVPTGNFGDIFAGYMAARMGLPVSRLILATNENDILTRFFSTGDYSLGDVHPTLSPSMDIQVASNFERYLFYRLGQDAERVRSMMRTFGSSGSLKIEPDRDGAVDPLFAAGRADTPQTLDAMRRCWEQHRYLLDPHTAVGVHVATALRQEGEPVVCLATAHPAKFPEAIRQATGQDLAHHPEIDALKGRPTRCDTLPASVDAVREYLREKIGRDEAC